MCLHQLVTLRRELGILGAFRFEHKESGPECPPTHPVKWKESK
jgi:hypothetical protein